MPDKKFKTPNGQIVNESELSAKYGDRFNSLIQDKTFSEVTEPVYKTPNGKYATESTLKTKYGAKFDELSSNNTFVLDNPTEKKNSVATTAPPKLASATPTGSSVGVNPAFKNSTPSPIPDFNSMPKSTIQQEAELRKELASTKVTLANMDAVSAKTDQLSALQKANAKAVKEKEAKIDNDINAKIFTTDKAAIKQSIASEEDDTEFSDYAREGGKKVLNVAGGILNIFPKGVNALSGNTLAIPSIDKFEKKIPFGEDLKEVDAETIEKQKQDPNFRLSNEQRMALAKQKFAIKAEKAQHLDNASRILQDENPEVQARIKAKSINEIKSTSQTSKAMSAQIQVLDNQATPLRRELAEMDKTAKSGKYNDQFVVDYNTKLENYNKIVGQYSGLLKDKQKADKDNLTAQERLSIFKLDYNPYVKAADDIVGGFAKMGGDALYAMGKLDQKLNEIPGVQEFSDKYSIVKPREDGKNIFMAGADVLLTDAENRQAAHRQIKVSDIDGFGKFGGWFGQTVGTVAPFAIGFAIGSTELSLASKAFLSMSPAFMGFSTAAAGGAMYEMDKEMENTPGLNYSNWQYLAKTAGSVGSNALMFGNYGAIFKGNKALFESIGKTPGANIEFQKGLKDYANTVYKTAKGVNKTGMTMALVSGINMFVDNHILGKKHEGDFEQIADSWLEGAAMHGATAEMPKAIVYMAEKVIPNSAKKEIRANLAEIHGFTTELSTNKNLLPEEVTEIKGKIKVAQDKNEKVFRKSLKNASSYTPKQIAELLKADQDKFAITKAAETVKNGNYSKEYKEKELARLKVEFNEINTKTNSIFTDKYNAFDNLDKTEQDRLNGDAEESLQKELNPSREKVLKLTPEQIKDRALEIHKTEQAFNGMNIKDVDALKRTAMAEIAQGLTDKQKQDGYKITNYEVTQKVIKDWNQKIDDREAAEQKKNEPAPTLETQPQAEVPQQVEAEKVAEVTPEVTEVDKPKGLEPNGGIDANIDRAETYLGNRFEITLTNVDETGQSLPRGEGKKKIMIKTIDSDGTVRVNNALTKTFETAAEAKEYANKFIEKDSKPQEESPVEDVAAPSAEKPLSSQEENVSMDKESKKITVFHGGNLDGKGNFEDGNFYAAKDKNQAKAYSEGNGGKIYEYEVDENKLATEEQAREVISKLNIQPKNGIDKVEDLLLHEVLDDRFDTAISKEDFEKVKAELEKNGFEGISFTDEDITQKNKFGAENVVIFDPKTLKQKQSNDLFNRNDKEKDIYNLDNPIAELNKDGINYKIISDTLSENKFVLFKDNVKVKGYKTLAEAKESIKNEATPTTNTPTDGNYEKGSVVSWGGKERTIKSTVKIGNELRYEIDLGNGKSIWTNKAALESENAGKENGDTVTDGNVRPTATNVGESGTTEPKSPIQESVSKPVDGGEVKGEAEVAKDFNEDDISNFLNGEFGAKKPVETPKQEAEKPKKETTSDKYVEKPLNEIKTDETRFQNRTELDEEQLKSIKENWNENELDPVVIWKDEKGESFILAGHHRLEAAKQLGKKAIDARYFKGTESEAIKYATEKSNANRTMEQAYDRAKKLRQLRESGASKKEIEEFSKGDGKNKKFVVNLSHLNPKGNIMVMLKSFGKAGDKDTVRLTESAADWVGESRKHYPEFTDAHENELYDYLINKGNLKKIGNKTEFTTRLQKYADAVRLFPDEPLNIEHRGVKGDLEQSKTKEIDVVKADIKVLEKERDKGTPTEARLTEITKLIEIKNAELGKLNKQLAEAKAGDKVQGDLFDMALNTVTEKINEKQITDEQANEFINGENQPDESIIADIKSKAKTSERISETEIEKAIADADAIMGNEDVKPSTDDIYDVIGKEDAILRNKQQKEINEAKADLDKISNGDSATISKYVKKSGYKLITKETIEESNNPLLKKALVNREGDYYKSTGASVYVETAENLARNGATRKANSKAEGLGTNRINEIMVERSNLQKAEANKALKLAKIDEVATWIKKATKADINPDDYHNQGFAGNTDKLIDLIANAVKSLVSNGMDLSEAIAKVVESVKAKFGDFDIDIEAVKERAYPKNEPLFVDENGDSYTSLKNAVSNPERESKGKDIVVVRDGKTDAERKQDLHDRIDSGEISQEEIRDLTTALANNAIEDVVTRHSKADMVTILLRNKVALENKTTEIRKELEANKGTEKEGQLLLDLARNEMLEDENYLASATLKGEWSEMGRNLQDAMKEDYSRPAIIKKLEDAAGNKGLSPEFRKKAGEVAQEIKDLQVKLDEHQAKYNKLEEDYKGKEAENADLQEKISKHEAERKLEKEQKLNALQSKKEFKIADIEKKQKLVIERIRAKYKGLSGTLNAGINPKYLELAPDVAILAKYEIQKGVATLEEVIGKVLLQLQDIIPELTERDVRDLFSGYGKSVIPKEVGENEKTLRKLKSKARAISGLQDVKEDGTAPLKTGYSHTPATEEVLAIRREIYREMRARGIDIKNSKDPEAVWKTALESYKTRTNNRIEYLENIAKSKDVERFLREKKKIKLKLDDEAKQLKKQQQNKKNVVDDMVAKADFETWNKFRKATHYTARYSKGILISAPSTVVKILASVAWRSAYKPVQAVSMYGVSKAAKLFGSDISRVQGINSGKDLMDHILDYYRVQYSKENVKGFLDTFKNHTSTEDVLLGKHFAQAPLPKIRGNKNLNFMQKAFFAHLKFLENVSAASHGAAKNMAALPEHRAWSNTILRNLVKEGIPESMLQDGTAIVIADHLGYLKGQRARFMQQNSLSSKKTAEVAQMVNKNMPLVADLIDLAFPILKIGSNYVGEALEKMPAIGLSAHAARGLSGKAFTEVQKADLLRALSNQGVGAFSLLAGAMLYQNIHPFFGTTAAKYAEKNGENLPEDEEALGFLKGLYTHSPDAVMMKAGAQMMWYWDMYDKANPDSKMMNVMAAIFNWETTASIINQSPYISSSENTIAPLLNGGDMGKVGANFVRSRTPFGDTSKVLAQGELPILNKIAPEAGKEIAKKLGMKPETVKPYEVGINVKGFGDNIGIGIPGWRDEILKRYMEEKDAPKMPKNPDEMMEGIMTKFENETKKQQFRSEH